MLQFRRVRRIKRTQSSFIPLLGGVATKYGMAVKEKKKPKNYMVNWLINMLPKKM